jgi:Amidohydrolase
MRFLTLVLCAWLAAVPAHAADDLPIFDAHLHYNQEAFAPYPVPKVLELFRRNGVRGILANSRPNDGSRRLFDARSEELWVVPFVRPYRTRADIATWFRDPEILALIEAELARGDYRGIGEFHLHGKDATGGQVKRIVDLAVARDLWLHAHSDQEAVEALFVHNPQVRVIWAHTGFSLAPETVESMIRRYPALMCELSYRSGLTEGGKLTPAWHRLFTTHTERFVVGSDTWVNERWESYDSLIAGYRAWLAQLPRDAAEKIAFKNAERLFPKR